jgi:sigma-B regulation protein RsbU (phosphoserine phosphatase)
MFSIRYKFLAIIVALVVATVSTYMVLAVRLFESDKEAYIYDSSAAFVEAIAAETEVLVDGVGKTLRAAGRLALAEGEGAKAARDGLIAGLFDGDADLIELAVGDQAAKPLVRLVKQEFLDLQGVDAEMLTKVGRELPVPFARMQPDKVYLKATTLPGGVPLILLALRVASASGKADMLVTGQIRQERLLKIFARSQSYTAYMIDGYGNVLAHPDVSMVVSRENVADKTFVERVLASPFPTGTMELQGSASMTKGQRWLVAFARLDTLGVTVVARIARDTAFAATRRLAQKSALFALALILASVIVSVGFTKTLTRPINRLFAATRTIASGDFGVRVESSSRDEIGALTTSFNVMAGKIVTLMSQVADKARMEKELETARVVQDNLFPDADSLADGYELSGFYTPASECGGDWWGYFTVGRQLVVLIGDATGHGVPAALITAAAQSCCTTVKLIKEKYPKFPLTPSTIMAHLNAAVYHAAKGNMNMTFFIGSLDLDSGLLTYTNASHEMPVVYGKDGDDARVSMLTGTPDVCLGDSTAAEFNEHTHQLEPGDTIVWYTDGLVELRNAADAEWGERRMVKFLKKNLEDGPKDLRGKIIAEARKFSENRPADDDITYIVVKWARGAEGVAAVAS